MPKRKCEFCNKMVEVRELELPYISKPSKIYTYVYFPCCQYLKQKTFLGRTELKKLYSSNYIVFKSNHLKDAITNIFIKLRVNKYKSLIKGKSILELGAGMGDFLVGARDLNPKEIFGIEGSQFACNYIRKKYGINVINGDIESLFIKKKFDTIFMFHVIEHMRNPRALIRKCLRHLNDNGSLIIETPNLASWDSKLFKKNWYNLSVPHHTYIFSPKTFEVLLSNHKEHQSYEFSFSIFPNALSKQFRKFPKILIPLILIFLYSTNISFWCI